MTCTRSGKNILVDASKYCSWDTCIYNNLLIQLKSSWIQACKCFIGLRPGMARLEHFLRRRHLSVYQHFDSEHELESTQPSPFDILSWNHETTGFLSHGECLITTWTAQLRWSVIKDFIGSQKILWRGQNI